MQHSVARSLVPGVHSSEREQELDLEMGEYVQLPGMAENVCFCHNGSYMVEPAALFGLGRADVLPD